MASHSTPNGLVFTHNSQIWYPFPAVLSATSFIATDVLCHDFGTRLRCGHYCLGHGSRRLVCWEQCLFSVNCNGTASPRASSSSKTENFLIEAEVLHLFEFPRAAWLRARQFGPKPGSLGLSDSRIALFPEEAGRCLLKSQALRSGSDPRSVSGRGCGNRHLPAVRGRSHAQLGESPAGAERLSAYVRNPAEQSPHHHRTHPGHG